MRSNRSPHVLREVERAGNRRIPIMVYKLEEVALTKSLEYFLMTNQWIDGTDDYHCSKVLEAFKNLPDPSGERSSQEKRETGTGQTVNNVNVNNADQKKQIVLALLILLMLLIICGAFILAMRVWSGTKSTVFKGTVLKSMTQGTENIDLSLGASTELGSYEGEPIVWRVLHASEDGTQLILVSDKILTMKAFDAPESGRYNYDGDKDYWTTVDPYGYLLEARVRGSNLWSDSNIRTWLNSERENVVYEDQPPAASAMSEKKNGYSSEAGFLHGFTKEELAVLRETENFTMGNILISSGGIWTEDRVFLLSERELDWFAEADVSIYTSPTDSAVEQDQTGWYDVQSLSFGVKEYIWLLRDPDFESTSRCRAVSNGYQAEGIVLQQLEAGCEGYGIRPAICVDREALIKFLSSKK